MEEMLMEEMYDIMSFFPFISLINLLTTAFCILFMHYSAKHRNHQLGLGWYVCGVFFGIWTVLVFLLKRKDFPGPDLKVCPSCGNKCPVNYEVCNRCLVELPEINTEEKAKQKKLSKIFGTGLIVTELTAFFIGSVMGVVMFRQIMDIAMGDYDSGYRISVNGVFYDKKGNAYENENDVLLYDQEGRIYTHSVEKVTAEEGYEYDEYYYVRDDGEKYYESDCYVTNDGWFYCDKGGLLEYYYPDTENMSEEELDAYYKEKMENDESEYKYYDDYLVDKKGNVYYCAYEASWNEKGELITAENDVSVTE